MDAAGNVSETATVVFYMITLNANGGTASVEKILAKDGAVVALPTASNGNLEFAGWATDVNAADGVVSITATANATYYAIWHDSFVYGDCDGNEEITSLDALYVLQASVGTRAITDDLLARCDVTGDGEITSLDALYILQFAVGTRTSFPVENK